MELFNGFRSVAEYEAACQNAGFRTLRVPFKREGEDFFVLITAISAPTFTSVQSWHLFTADGKQHLLDGVINGNDANFLGKLAAAGFSPAI